MGKQTEYLKGQWEYKTRILEYLKVRKESMMNIIKEGFEETGEIEPKALEVAFAYNAMISDIKNDRID